MARKGLRKPSASVLSHFHNLYHTLTESLLSTLNQSTRLVEVDVFSDDQFSI